jgi:hypothetical protein
MKKTTSVFANMLILILAVSVIVSSCSGAAAIAHDTVYTLSA